MFLNNLCNTLEQLLDLLVEVTDMQTQGSGNIRPACLLESITLLGTTGDQLGTTGDQFIKEHHMLLGMYRRIWLHGASIISQEQIVDGIGLG